MFEITEITTETERERAREVYLTERFRNLERSEPLEEALAPCTKERLDSGLLRLMAAVLRYETPHAKRLRESAQRRSAINHGYPGDIRFDPELPLWKDHHDSLIQLTRIADCDVSYDLWRITTRKVEQRARFALYQKFVGRRKHAVVMEFVGLKGPAAYAHLLGKGLFQMQAPLARVLRLWNDEYLLDRKFSPFTAHSLRALGFETLVGVVVGYRVGSVALREQANQAVREELQGIVPSIRYSGLLG